MRTRLEKPTHCECGRELLDTITACSGEGCTCKIVLRTCQVCERAWGYDYTVAAWTELEEVEESEI